MDLSEVIQKRRSVRKFKDTEISTEIINDILKNASLAPETDTCNYYFGVINETKLRYGDEIVDYFRKHSDRKACKTLLQASPVYIAAQHIILTAVSHNLRGCLVDFIDIERINKILGLPKHVTSQVLVPVGYADEIPKKKDGYNIEERVFYNNWRNKLG